MMYQFRKSSFHFLCIKEQYPEIDFQIIVENALSDEVDKKNYRVEQRTQYDSECEVIGVHSTLEDAYACIDKTYEEIKNFKVQFMKECEERRLITEKAKDQWIVDYPALFQQVLVAFDLEPYVVSIDGEKIQINHSVYQRTMKFKKDFNYPFVINGNVAVRSIEAAKQLMKSKGTVASISKEHDLIFLGNSNLHKNMYVDHCNEVKMMLSL